MKIEECKKVVYKSISFSGSTYTLEDKDILLNSINILAHQDVLKRQDCCFAKNVCDFTIQRLSKNQYKIFIPDYTTICNNFIINYGVLRDVKVLTLDKNECPDVTTKSDGSLEIAFQEDKEE